MDAIPLDETVRDYNRFYNLDSIEDRIIYYLISPVNKTDEQLKYVHQIWKLLKYDDIDALNKDLPTYSEIIKLICNNDIEENCYRIFRSPYFSEAWTQECSLIRVYIDSIVPRTHLTATVYIGIDVITHTKLINTKIADDDDSSLIEYYNGEPIKIKMKNRVDILVKSILYLLNGVTIQQLGELQFNQGGNLGNLAQARYAIWNHRNYLGCKIVFASSISGVN
jgi:hypothetical protein